MVSSKHVFTNRPEFATNVFFSFPLRFNYRATAYMVQHGFYEFLNWFDERAWYPLGKKRKFFVNIRPLTR